MSGDGETTSGLKLSRRVVAIAGESRFALEQVIRSLPASSGRSYVVAYTGAGDFMPSARLASPLPVVEITAGVLPRADHVYVSPVDRQVIFVDGVFAFADAAGEPRAPIDRLFRTLADALGRDATGIVLAGHGSDGTLGIKRLKEVGALTIAQAATDADFPAMPLAAIGTGMIDLVLPASEIPAQLGALVETPEITDADTRRNRDELADALRDILTLVRIRSGHDFSHYKRAILYRRVARRMQVCQTPSIASYHTFLREHPSELASLVHDFLISVTNFFRDAEAFEALSGLVVSQMFANPDATEHRIWVCGCATGEEAYSLGILLLERASRRHEPRSIQIFATDIDEGALAVARTGRYSDAIAVDVSPARLERYFVREGNQYRVGKELRELVLFSPHNVLRDPPFSRLDLVSCRNLLIYLDRDAQERALSMFHFGLRTDGHLFLGTSESVEQAAGQFTARDAKSRVFSRKLAPTSLGFDHSYPGARWPASVAALSTSVAGDRSATSYGELHHRVVEHYAAPSVLVNEELDVVHVSEHAGRFLAMPGGEPTRQLLRLVHPGLRLEVRSAIYRARQIGRGGDTRVIRFEDDGRLREVELRVREVDKPELGTRMLLVVFDEREVVASAAGEVAPRSSTGDVEPVLHELEDELQRTRDHLRATIEQYETSVEELKASNEELHAINEELRSASEELETSKEELQSVNEELSTVNLELKSNVDELGRANSDLQNLMTSTEIGVMFLDRSLRIMRFTPRVQDVFNVIAGDLGRPLAHLTHKLDVDDLHGSALEVIQHLRTIEREVRTHDGRHFLVRILPYRSLEDRIEGVVMTFVDVSDLAAAEDAVRASDQMLRLAERAANAGIWTIHMAARRMRMSDECARLHGFEPPATLGLGDWLNRVAARDRDRVRAAVDHALAGDAELSIEYQITHPAAGTRWLWSLGRAPAAGTLAGITIDVTDRRRGEAALRASEERFRATLAAAPVVATRQDAQLRYTWGYVLGRELAVGDNLDAHLSASEGARLGELKHVALRTRARQQDELELDIDGETRTFDVHVEPIFDDGAIAGLTTVAFDISASKRAEAILRDSDRRKDEFLATLSHELRNPLNPLRVALDLQKLAPQSPAQLARMHGIMDRQVDQLIALVDDLLDLARINRDTIEIALAPVDARTIVAAAVEDTHAQFEKVGHALAVHVGDAPVVVRGDTTRLVQILVNLLNNAAKYTPAPGQIAISLHAAGGQATFSVRDDGVGIAADDLKTVFELFAQCRDSRGRARGGLGIGLNLVQRLVTLHGGRVLARSDGPGRGSEFIVEIPLETT